MGKDLKQQWELIVSLVEQLNIDIRKNIDQSNLSAGVRARKGLRLLRTLMKEVQYDIQERDKEIKAERRTVSEADKEANIRNLQNLQNKKSKDT